MGNEDVNGGDGVSGSDGWVAVPMPEFRVDHFDAAFRHSSDVPGHVGLEVAAYGREVCEMTVVDAGTEHIWTVFTDAETGEAHGWHMGPEHAAALATALMRYVGPHAMAARAADVGLDMEVMNVPMDTEEMEGS